MRRAWETRLLSRTRACIPSVCLHVPASMQWCWADRCAFNIHYKTWNGNGLLMRTRTQHIYMSTDSPAMLWCTGLPSVSTNIASRYRKISVADPSLWSLSQSLSLVTIFGTYRLCYGGKMEEGIYIRGYYYPLIEINWNEIYSLSYWS